MRDLVLRMRDLVLNPTVWVGVIIAALVGFVAVGGWVFGEDPDSPEVAAELARDQDSPAPPRPKFGWTDGSATSSPTDSVTPTTDDSYWEELLAASDDAQAVPAPNPQPVTVPMKGADKLDGYCRDTFGGNAGFVLLLKPASGGTAYQTIIYRVTGGGIAEVSDQPPIQFLSDEQGGEPQPGYPLAWKTDLNILGGRAVIYDPAADTRTATRLVPDASYIIPPDGQAVHSLTICAY
jgi:hypothetical protein